MSLMPNVVYAECHYALSIVMVNASMLEVNAVQIMHQSARVEVFSKKKKKKIFK